jgi:hypothetical protein
MGLRLHAAPIRSLPVAISEQRLAECAELELTLSSDQKYPAERAEEVRRMLEEVQRRANAMPGITVHESAVRVSMRTGSKILTTASSASTVQLRAEFGDGDVWTHLSRFQQLLDSLAVVGKGTYRAGDVLLTVFDAEAHRELLLRRLVQHIEESKALWGNQARIEISGLESPVHVTQVSRREIALWLDYKLKIRV